MVELIIRFGLSLAILLFSSQKMVALAQRVSRILKISPLVVGITIVAIGTSLPELAVSLISVLRNDTGLAMGNLVGSNVVNVLMVFPVGLLLGKLRIGTTKIQRSALLLLVSTIVFFLVILIGPIKFVSGSILIGLAVLFIILEIIWGEYGKKHEDLKQIKTLKNDNLDWSLVVTGLLLVTGIIGGSILLVDTVEKISLFTGISTTILGLTLTAIATSLPELLTTIFSLKDNQEKISVGIVIGSNIYNLLLFGGIVVFISTSAIILLKEWFWLGLTTIIFVIILRTYRGKIPPKWLGLLLLLLLFIYLLFQ